MLEKNGLYAQPIVMCGKTALKTPPPRLYLFTRRRLTTGVAAALKKLADASYSNDAEAPKSACALLP